MSKKYFMTDDQVKSLVTEDALHEYIDHIKKNDVLVEPYINECAAIGMQNMPLFFESFKEENGVDADTKDIEECCESNGIFLVFPGKGKMECFPTRYTAYNSICQRAGLTGSSMTTTVSSSRQKALAPERKAAFISECMKLYSDNAKVLIRDGKVSAMHSKQYAWFLPYDIFPIIEENFKKTWPDYKYAGGEVSHEYLYANYMLNDPAAEASMKLTLESLGAKIDGAIKAGIRVSTSDVGLSAVRFSPFYIINGTSTRLGKPVEMIHDTKRDMKYFEKELLPSVGLLMKEAEDDIEKLGNVDIKYPAGCLQHICLDKKQIPFMVAKEAIEAMQIEYPNGCQAIDIYLKLNEIVEMCNVKKPMSPSRYMEMTEYVARMMFISFDKYDLPLVDM